ncbi:MAG: Do family serine endopeptidase [Pseudohongiellaceae bacterium]
MKLHRYCNLALMLVMALGVNKSLALSAAAVQQGLPSLAPMLEHVIPGVVSIRVSNSVEGPDLYSFNGDRIPDELRRFFDFDLPQQRLGPQPGQRNRAIGAGSGVIVDAVKGYVITNHHVIDDAEEITVILNDGRSLTAELLGSDAGTDVALLKIEATNLTAIAFADSDTVRIGDFVVAIGNPYGIGQTVTAGIVSALGRAGLNNENYEDYIQTDAAINVGNSGGALVDMEGLLVGINSAIISGNGGGSDGIGFAVPSNMVATVMAHLERDGEVRRGLLGVQISNLTPQLAETLKIDHQTGALVTNVLPGGAAEQAGVEIYDVITSINGNPVASGRELRNAIGLLGVDQQVQLNLIRNGREMQLAATLIGNDRASVAQSDAPRPASRPDFNGARLSDNPVADGVAVAAVDPQSRAAAAGLRPGDVIIEVNREAVEDLADFNRRIVTSEGLIALTVLREERRMLLIMS